MIGGNKLALEIYLIGDRSIEIRFLNWDERFLSSYNNKNVEDDVFVYFETLDEKFCLFSQDDGYILDIGQFTLVVPDKESMRQGSILSHTFPNDDIRYSFLRTMYEHIEEWADTWTTFINDEVPNHDLIVHQQFWIY